jgi:hypothetical protein
VLVKFCFYVIEGVSELLSRLRTAATANPIIVSWKNHIPKTPPLFDCSVALHVAEKLFYVMNLAHEKSAKEAFRNSNTKEEFEKYKKENFTKNERLA